MAENTYGYTATNQDGDREEVPEGNEQGDSKGG